MEEWQIEEIKAIFETRVSEVELGQRVCLSSESLRADGIISLINATMAFKLSNWIPMRSGGEDKSSK